MNKHNADQHKRALKRALRFRRMWLAGHTYQEIGRRYGISKQRVAQILENAFGRGA